MIESGDEADPNDFLVLPGSNRNPPKSNVLARANQIRAALQNVDNEQRQEESEFEQLRIQHEQLQSAYQNLQRFIAEQEDSENERIKRLESENKALRQQLQKGRSEKNHPADNQSISSTKYEKALKEIATLMNFNKDLKGQLEYMKTSSVDKQEFQRMYGNLMEEKNEILMVAQREQLRRKEVQETLGAYQMRMQEMQDALNQHQEQYEHEVGKLVNVINSYGADADKMRKRAEKCDLLEQQLLNHQSMDQSKLQELEQLRIKQAGTAREIHQLKQLVDQLQMQIHQRQMSHQRELEGLKQKVQDDGGKAVRTLQDQLAILKQENTRLRQSKEELESYTEGVLEQMRNKNSREGSSGQAVEEMKRYVNTLRSETNKLREVLASKDQLLADKSGLNKEVVALNRQVAILTHDNAQLKIMVEGGQANQTALVEQIRRLELQVEEERAQSAKLHQQNVIDSRIASPTSVGNHSTEVELQRLISENDSLRQRLAKALEFTSLQHVAGENRPILLKPQRPIPLNIRIRELRVLLQLLISGSGGSTVTMETAQLTDLKTFTVQFDERLKLLANENDHLKKKVQDYRHKYHEAQREQQSVEQQNDSLSSKVQGYQKLVQKLQSELERSIRKAQQTAGQMTLSSLNRGHLETELRIQIADLNQKLQLQGKYLNQQLQTQQLEYEARLVASQKRLDGYQQEIESVSLYTSKIQELSEKLVQVEMLNNQYKVQLAHLERVTHARSHVETKSVDSNMLLRQVYDKLAEREAEVLKLDYSLKERHSELQERADLQNELRQQLYESELELERLREVVRTAQQSEQRITAEAKHMDAEQQRKLAELQKQNTLLQKDLEKLQSFQEELAGARQANHLLKVNGVQNSERVSQLEAELSRLRTVDQALRELNIKYGELEGTSQHTKASWEGEKARLQRQLKDKQSELSDLARFLSRLKEESANEVKQLRTHISEYEAESESIRRNSEVTRYKTTEIEQENNRLRAQINYLAQEVDRYRQNESRTYQAEKKLMDTGLSLQSQKHKLQFITKENQRLKQRIQELEDVMSRAQGELNDRQRTIRTQKNEMLDLNMRIEQLGFKNGSLRSEVDRMQTVVDGVVQQSLQNSRRIATSTVYREQLGGTTDIHTDLQYSVKTQYV